MRESHTGREGGLQQAGEGGRRWEGGKRWGSEGEGEGEEGEGDGSLSWCGGFLLLCRQDHTLMGALSRVLGDEYRKSMELTYNIMRIFLAFSNFVEVGAARQITTHRYHHHLQHLRPGPEVLPSVRRKQRFTWRLTPPCLV